MWLLVALCLFLAQSADKQAPQKLVKKTAEWSYDFSLKHVSKGWGETCLHGERQSPIALPSEDQLKEWKNSIPLIDWNKDRRVKIVGEATGKTLRFKGSKNDLGKITLGKEEYSLKYFDLHMGSEHTIGGKRSAMEIQFVHENAASEHSKVILSILCDESDDKSLPTMNVFMNRIVGIQDGTKKDACPGEAFGKPMELDLHTATIGQFEKANVDKLFYRYIGSDTTPPCKEKVKWIVMGGQCRLDNEKILEWLRKQDSLKNNFRPTQDVNGRVLYVGPTMDKENEFKWKSKDKDQQKKPANNEIKKKKEDTEPKNEDTKEKRDEAKDETEQKGDKKDEERKDSKKADKADQKIDEEAKSDDKEETNKDEKEDQKEDAKEMKKAVDEKKADKADEKIDQEAEKSNEKADEKEDDKKADEKKDDQKANDKADEKKDDQKSNDKEDEKKDEKGDKESSEKEDETSSKDVEKTPQDDDQKPSDKKKSSDAAASVHTHTINSRFLKPLLAGALGLAVLLTLCGIFHKRRKNEYELLLDVEDDV